ncbi:MAG: MBL fold metallo-hydrolase [Nocardioides sp.]|nr:MBL fold metallo-hydrolase [Nocardioides sp.]
MKLATDQLESAKAAFGLFSETQARNMFSKEHGSGFEPIVIEAAPRTHYIQPGMVNVALFETDEGLLLVDCGCAGDGPALVKAVRAISDKPLHTIVYTHGHSDHAFGAWAFLEAGEKPEIIAHENLVGHFRRYMLTNGLNARINGQAGRHDGPAWAGKSEADFDWPTRTFSGDRLDLTIGGERFELHHGMGETDDAVWVWAPERGVIAAGDLVTGYFPNAGNPKKVQRWATEWADAAEAMAALDPKVIIPGHGALVTGHEAIKEELTTMAAYLRHINDHAVRGLNEGVLPDHIIESLEVPASYADHPRLPPVYDRPEFVARNVVRRYGGWWDGYPSHLLPATQEQQAAEVAALAGGVPVLVSRARALVATDLRLATHVAEWAFLADRNDAEAQACYEEILEKRAASEKGLMAQTNLRVGKRWVEQARVEHTRKEQA